MRGLVFALDGRFALVFMKKIPMKILLIITCLIVVAFKVLSWSSFSRHSVPDTEKKLEPN